MTYEAVGFALSSWEHYEAALSLLFSMLVGNFASRAGRRAYNAVRTFEARAEMLRAASESYFQERPHAEYQAAFKTIYKSARNYSPRRNDIAHGVVSGFSAFPYGSAVPLPLTFCLYPSMAAYKDRDHDEAPEYCYTSIELKYFGNAFWDLMYPAFKLAMQLHLKDTGREALLEKRPSPDRA